MPSTVKKTTLYFILFGLWLILLVTLLLTQSRYDLFVLINHHRSWIADVIFTIFTEIGSGLALIPMAIYFLFKKNYEILLGFLVILLVNTLLVSVLKHAFYESRPLMAFGKNVVQTASWVSLHNNYSFPSGHTALGFAIATYYCLHFKNNNFILIGFFVAFLIGYSRVYLGQHFPLDVCAGSILGFLIAFSYYGIEQLIKYIKKNKKDKLV